MYKLEAAETSIHLTWLPRKCSPSDKFNPAALGAQTARPKLCPVQLLHANLESVKTQPASRLRDGRMDGRTAQPSCRRARGMKAYAWRHFRSTQVWKCRTTMHCDLTELCCLLPFRFVLKWTCHCFWMHFFFSESERTVHAENNYWPSVWRSPRMKAVGFHTAILSDMADFFLRVTVVNIKLCLFGGWFIWKY